MRKKLILPFLLLPFLAIVAFSQTNSAPSPLADSRQILLVTTKDWSTVPGTLHRFTRDTLTSPWTEIAPAIPIVVGRNGLGWGRGLNPDAHLPGPIKKEGDGKSPAGIFRLSAAFGLLEPSQIKPLKLPYQYLSDGIECVDDLKSTNYNSIVDRAQTAQPDWDSSEKMRTVAQYRLGVVVDHNTDPREPGGGSCIFIHIWKDAQSGTSGCTAMTSENIDTVVPWLDPAANPVLVQLPESAYQTLKTPWQLP